MVGPAAVTPAGSIAVSQGDPRRARAVVYADSVPGRWAHRPGHQSRRVCDPAHQLGLQNSLFAGSEDGTNRWAIVASLVETAKLNGVEPYTWLRESLALMLAELYLSGTRLHNLFEIMANKKKFI